MARITITTDQGEVADIIHGSEIGDLTKPMPRAAFIIRINEALEDAAKLDAQRTEEEVRRREIAAVTAKLDAAQESFVDTCENCKFPQGSHAVGCPFPRWEKAGLI